MAWAHSYLKQANLVDAAGRGVYRLSDRGREALETSPPRIDIAYLMKYPEFAAFRHSGGQSAGLPPPAAMDTNAGDATADLTPDEQIRLGYERLQGSLRVQTGVQF